MYAQLFYISEEDNHYPQTDKVVIDDSLENLLAIPEWCAGNEAYWNYTNLSERQSALSNGLSVVDNNNF